MPQSTTNVEAEYQRRIDAMTPAERVARGAAMFQMTRDAIARRIVAELGPLPDEVLKWHVAMQLYGDSEDLRPIIQEQIDRAMQESDG